MYSAGVVQVLPRRRRALMMRSSRNGGPSEVDNDQLRAIIKADPLKTTWEVVKGLNVDHSTFILNLKQIEKVKKLDKWLPHELTADQKKKKSLFWSVIFFYSSQQQIISQSDCDLWQKVDFIWQPETTSLVVGLRSSFKARPKAKLAPKKGHGHCLVICCCSDPPQLSESWLKPWHLRNAQKIDEIHQKLQCLHLG